MFRVCPNKMWAMILIISQAFDRCNATDVTDVTLTDVTQNTKDYSPNIDIELSLYFKQIIFFQRF